MSEREIQRAILIYLGQHPRVVAAWRNQSGMVKTYGGRWMHLAPAGTPDIVGILDGGRFLGVEVKDPATRGKGKWADQEHQESWRVKANNAGALVVHATSVEDVRRALEEG